MALIGSIRDKGKYFLVGFLALALIIFVLSTFFDTLGTGTVVSSLGTIDGTKVDEEKYQAYTNQFAVQAQNAAQQQGKEFTEEDRKKSEDQAWQTTVDEIVLGKEFDALGVSVSDNEYKSYLYGTDGFTRIPDIENSFKDETGRFSPSKLDQFLKQKRTSKDAKEIAEWKVTEEMLRKQRQQEKYFQILGQGVYVTKLELESDYLAKNTKKSISIVSKSFSDIDNKKVKVTDAEVQAFYDIHKEEYRYKKLAGRDVKYFDITIEPSRADSTKMMTKFNALKGEYSMKKGAEDSLFVLAKSEMKMYNSKLSFRPAGDPKAQGTFTYPKELDTVFKSTSVGGIVGPYYDQGKVRLTKVLGFNTKSCTVRHILIEAKKGDVAKEASGKKLADSLMKLITKDNFETYVMQFSTDPGSKDKGGKYEDFLPSDMVTPFANFSEFEPIGKIGVVKTDFGYHIMEVLGRTEVRVPMVSFIEETMKPSTETAIALNDKATNILMKIENKVSKQENLLKKLAIFDTIAREEGFFSRPVNMLEEAPKVQGFNTDAAVNKILQLAFNEDAEVGQLCGAPIIDKERYVIAMLASIRTEEGVPTFEDAYSQMKTALINEKKAKMIMASMKGFDLELIAKKNGTIVNKADASFDNPSLPGGSYEPKVIGAIFGDVKDGKTSAPIIGDNGVYIFKVNKTVKAPASTTYDTEKVKMLQQLRGQVSQQARVALMKKLKVTDNRALLNANIYR